MSAFEKNIPEFNKFKEKKDNPLIRTVLLHDHLSLLYQMSYPM